MRPQTDAVFCGKDAMRSALNKAPRRWPRDKVKAFGSDGSDDAIRSVNEGKLAATAMQYPKVMAKTVAELADRYLRRRTQIAAKGAGRSRSRDTQQRRALCRLMVSSPNAERAASAARVARGAGGRDAARSSFPPLHISDP